MSQLTDNLSAIAAIKSDIAAAIESKGVSMSGVSFGSYADKIGEIQTGGTFVTETLSVSVNNTYYPGQGVDGFSQVIVDVPQSVTGFTEKEMTEKTYTITNLNNSASYVASSAFQNTNTLQTVNLPNCTVVYNNAFSGCNYLSQLSLPECKSIYSSAFTACSSLYSVDLPKCEYLQYAFTYCNSLVSISLPECSYLSDRCFIGCSRISYIDLPKCSIIYRTVFESMQGLLSVSIPECRLMLATGAFSNCRNLLEISAPKCLNIGNSAFYSCYSLSSVYLPECASVGGIAFQYCSQLTELDLPGCGFISGAVVNDCPNLTSVNIPMAISFAQWYGNPVFCASNLSELHLCIDVYGCPSYSIVLYSTTSIHKGIGSVYVNEQNYDYFIFAVGWSNISSQIVSVSTSAGTLISFSDGLLSGDTRAIASNFSIYTAGRSNNITRVSLPNCEYINASTFDNCSSLSEIYIPNCKYLGYQAFNRCSSLTSINLDNCAYIEGEAFRYCRSLSSIYIRTSNVCLIDNQAFWNTMAPSTSFFVPASLVDAYKSTLYWSSYSNRIFPIPE